MGNCLNQDLQDSRICKIGELSESRITQMTWILGILFIAGFRQENEIRNITGLRRYKQASTELRGKVDQISGILHPSTSPAEQRGE